LLYAIRKGDRAGGVGGGTGKEGSWVGHNKGRPGKKNWGLLNSKNKSFLIQFNSGICVLKGRGVQERFVKKRAEEEGKE